MRTAAIIEKSVVVNVIVVADGAEGDEAIAAISGAVEIVDQNVRIGSRYENEQFVWVKTPEEIYSEQQYAEQLEARKVPLRRLGLTEEEINTVLGL